MDASQLADDATILKTKHKTPIGFTHVAKNKIGLGKSRPNERFHGLPYC